MGGHSEEIEFHDLQAQPSTVRYGLLEDAFEARLFPEWLPDVRKSNEIIPARIINKNRNKLEKAVAEDALRRRASYAYLIGPEIKCKCGVRSEFFFEFKWGQLNNYIEYRMGETIEWKDNIFGYPEVKKVYVIGRPDSRCLACGQGPGETLICIENNRIVSLVPELLGSVQYTFHGPFVSDDLISWDDYQTVSYTHLTLPTNREV